MSFIGWAILCIIAAGLVFVVAWAYNKRIARTSTLYFTLAFAGPILAVGAGIWAGVLGHSVLQAMGAALLVIGTALQIVADASTAEGSERVKNDAARDTLRAVGWAFVMSAGLCALASVIFGF